MTKVVISGYYGFGNWGDEAVLWGTVKGLRQKLPNVEIVVLSKDPKATSSSLGVKAVNRWSLGAIGRELWKARAFLSGGGSLFQDVTSRRTLYYYAGLCLLALLLRKKLVLYAQGIGPLRKHTSKLLVRFLANRAALVTLRDKASAEFLSSLGVERPLLVTADPAFLLAGEEIAPLGKRLLSQARVPEGRPLVGFSLRPWCGEERYKEVIARLVRELDAWGFEPLFLPFHPPADLKISAEVARASGKEKNILALPRSPLELLALVANLNFLVGMRLHALIFAALAGVPFLGLVYDPKVKAFLEETKQLDGGEVESVDFDYLRTQVALLLSRKAELEEHLKEKRKELKAQAEKNISQVVRLLQEPTRKNGNKG